LVEDLYKNWNFDAIYFNKNLQSSLRSDASKYARPLADQFIDDADFGLSMNMDSQKVCVYDSKFSVFTGKYCN